jgi:peptide/nickel transport system permease protein
MLGFLLRRVGQALIVLLAVSVLCFVALRFVGDPVLQMLPRNATEQMRQDLRHELGLDQPIPIQYARFLGRAVQGDLGHSYHHNEAALSLIMTSFGATLELALAAMIFAIVMAMPLGILAAVKPRGAMARTILTGSLLGISMPTFLTGVLLLFIFAVTPVIYPDHWLFSRLPRMPSSGAGEATALLGTRIHLNHFDNWRYVILPAITLGGYYLAVLIRLVRSEMIEQLNRDHVTVARAKGLSEWRVTIKHAYRNALIPVVTVMGMQFGGLIAFSIVTETIFQWPGMGKLLIESIAVNDQPVITAYLLVVAIIFVTINLGVDLVYGLIDPRIRVHA